MRYILILGTLLVCLSVQAAQVCKIDAENICKQDKELGNLAKCLFKNEAKLSKPCADKISEGFTTNVDCAKATNEICGDKVMGKGLGKCILENEAELEKRCKG
jgi:hypothetical protein